MEMVRTETNRVQRTEAALRGMAAVATAIAESFLA